MVDLSIVICYKLPEGKLQVVGGDWNTWLDYMTGLYDWIMTFMTFHFINDGIWII